VLVSTAKRCFSSPVVPVVRAGRLELRVVRVTCGRYVLGAAATTGWR
jgi:hypothetical protein